MILKSTRPSFLIKRAALGNLKVNFHCAHWHRFFPLKKGLSKTHQSSLTLKGGSTSHLGLLPSGKKRKPLLPVALNRCAIRLAGHQSPRQGCFSGDEPAGTRWLVYCVICWKLADFLLFPWWFQLNSVFLRQILWTIIKETVLWC